MKLYKLGYCARSLCIGNNCQASICAKMEGLILILLNPKLLEFYCIRGFFVESVPVHKAIFFSFFDCLGTSVYFGNYVPVVRKFITFLIFTVFLLCPHYKATIHYMLHLSIFPCSTFYFPSPNVLKFLNCIFDHNTQVKFEFV